MSQKMAAAVKLLLLATPAAGTAMGRAQEGRGAALPVGFSSVESGTGRTSCWSHWSLCSCGCYDRCDAATNCQPEKLTAWRPILCAKNKQDGEWQDVQYAEVYNALKLKSDQPLSETYRKYVESQTDGRTVQTPESCAPWWTKAECVLQTNELGCHQPDPHETRWSDKLAGEQCADKVKTCCEAAEGYASHLPFTSLSKVCKFHAATGACVSKNTGAPLGYSNSCRATRCVATSSDDAMPNYQKVWCSEDEAENRDPQQNPDHCTGSDHDGWGFVPGFNNGFCAAFQAGLAGGHTKPDTSNQKTCNDFRDNTSGGYSGITKPVWNADALGGSGACVIGDSNNPTNAKGYAECCKANSSSFDGMSGPNCDSALENPRNVSSLQPANEPRFGIPWPNGATFGVLNFWGKTCAAFIMAGFDDGNGNFVQDKAVCERMKTTYPGSVKGWDDVNSVCQSHSSETALGYKNCCIDLITQNPDQKKWGKIDSFALSFACDKAYPNPYNPIPETGDTNPKRYRETYIGYTAYHTFDLGTCVAWHVGNGNTKTKAQSKERCEAVDASMGGGQYVWWENTALPHNAEAKATDGACISAGAVNKLGYYMCCAGLTLGGECGSSDEAYPNPDALKRQTFAQWIAAGQKPDETGPSWTYTNPDCHDGGDCPNPLYKTTLSDWGIGQGPASMTHYGRYWNGGCKAYHVGRLHDMPNKDKCQKIATDSACDQSGCAPKVDWNDIVTDAAGTITSFCTPHGVGSPLGYYKCCASGGSSCDHAYPNPDNWNGSDTSNDGGSYLNWSDFNTRMTTGSCMCNVVERHGGADAENHCMEKGIHQFCEWNGHCVPKDSPSASTYHQCCSTGGSHCGSFVSR